MGRRAITLTNLQKDGLGIPSGVSKCKVCGEDKPKNDFPKQGFYYQKTCKACVGEIQKERRLKKAKDKDDLGYY